MDWIATSTDRREILAHPAPQILTFFTGRPTISLPRSLDRDGLRTFLVDHRVAFVLLNGSDGTSRRYQRNLESIDEIKDQVAALGDYRIFDARGLSR